MKPKLTTILLMPNRYESLSVPNKNCSGAEPTRPLISLDAKIGLGTFPYSPHFFRAVAVPQPLLASLGISSVNISEPSPEKRGAE